MKDISEITGRLGSKDHIIRRGAVEQLGITEDETLVDVLIPLLNDEDRFVRQEVILALKKIGGSKVVEHLSQALDTEKNEFVRDYIKTTLERLQS